jgi:hypothetical protein
MFSFSPLTVTLLLLTQPALPRFTLPADHHGRFARSCFP